MKREQYEQEWQHIYRSRPDSEIHAIKCNEENKKLPKALDPSTDIDFPTEYAKAIDWMISTCGNFLVLPEGFNDAWRKQGAKQ